MAITTISEIELQVLVKLAGISIAPEYVEGVKQNLEALMTQAALLFDPPVDPLVEPAPVFNP